MKNNLIFYQLLPPHHQPHHQLSKLLHPESKDDPLSHQLSESYDDHRLSHECDGVNLKELSRVEFKLENA